jgi:D-alanyl-D-alanine carboxypeptidase (penicillin-binding protein 5/6)
MMVHSANDAANVLAFHISGSIESFADLMNEKLTEIGLTHTHFTNPSGMHNENHYSTAHDLALLMQYGMKDNTFRNFAGLKSCTIPATNKYEERVFNTTNELLLKDTRNVASNYYYPYAIAGKTGYTSQAKNCLVSVANKDGFELISVVLGEGLYANGLSAKFIESKSLFEYGYQTYTIQKIREQGAIGTQMDVLNGTKETRSLDLILSQDIIVLVKQSDMNEERTPTITLSENLMAPIAQGQKVGTICYEIDGINYSSDLVAAHTVEASSVFPIVVQIGILIIVLVLLYFLISSGRKKGKKRKKKVHRLF